MSITTGLVWASNFVLSNDPRAQAVYVVKVGKMSDLSMRSICSSSRGGGGIEGSDAMVTYE